MNYLKKSHFIQVLFLISGFHLSVAQITNPFALANSVYEEQNPVITPDGRALYFTIANHPDNPYVANVSIPDFAKFKKEFKGNFKQ